MTLKRERAGGTATLPRLDVPAEHEAIRQATPPDLKGLQYPTLPHVGQSNRSNIRSHDDEGPIILLPAIGEPHPFPYVVSPEVRLTGSGKEELYLDETQDQGFEDAALYFLMETKFSKEYFEEFLPSILLPEVNKIAKNTLHPEDGNKKRTFSSAGRPEMAAAAVMAPDAADGVMQLDSKDTEKRDDNQPKDDFLEEAVIVPMLQEESREVVWEMVDEKARSLPAWKVEEMNQKASQLTLSEPLRKAITRKACGRQATPEIEKQLAGAKLEKVLFEYQRVISKHKLTENFAMKLFQDEVISKSVEDRAINDGFRNLEKDVEMHESEEKRRHSPRS